MSTVDCTELYMICAATMSQGIDLIFIVFATERPLSPLPVHFILRNTFCTHVMLFENVLDKSWTCVNNVGYDKFLMIIFLS